MYYIDNILSASFPIFFNLQHLLSYNILPCWGTVFCLYVWPRLPLRLLQTTMITTVTTMPINTKPPMTPPTIAPMAVHSEKNLYLSTNDTLISSKCFRWDDLSCSFGINFSQISCNFIMFSWKFPLCTGLLLHFLHVYTFSSTFLSYHLSYINMYIVSFAFYMSMHISAIKSG